MVFPTLFKPNAMMQPNICLAQRNQNSVRASNFMFFTIRQIQTWDFRLEILKSEQLIQDPRFQKTLVQKSWIHGSKIQDPRFQKTLVQKSWIHGSKIQDFRKLFSRNLASKIQDFRKLLSRNLGSMDPRSKISENSCPEILDPSRNLGSMDPTPKIHGSKISGQEFSEILDLGS